jgi:hypothetical protein
MFSGPTAQSSLVKVKLRGKGFAQFWGEFVAEVNQEPENHRAEGGLYVLGTS